MSSIKILISVICVFILTAAIVAIDPNLRHRDHQEQRSFVSCPGRDPEVSQSGWRVYQNTDFGIQLDYPTTLVSEDEHPSTADTSWLEATVAQFTPPSGTDSEYIILGVERSDQKSGTAYSVHSMTINGIPTSDSIQQTETGAVRSFQYQPEGSQFHFDLSLTGGDSDPKMSSAFTQMAKSFRLIPKCVARSK